MKRALITGSSGLVGSEAVAFFEQRGFEVHGVDNNVRRSFFGPDGDTAWNLARLRREARYFTHHDLDIRDRDRIFDLMRTHRPDLVVHCAAQTRGDYRRPAGEGFRPFVDSPAPRR